MKKQHIIISGIAISVVGVVLLMQKKPNPSSDHSGMGGKNSETPGLNQGGSDSNHPDQNQTSNGLNSSGGTAMSGSSSNSGSSVGSAAGNASSTTAEAKKEDNCFQFSYKHQEKNQNRDIEEFLNDTNAFPIAHENVNQKSICVKVNDKPVAHKWVKKSGKAEVLIGSVVGPESTIQVSYCVGNTPCKESCIVKTKNKVDELLSETEISGVENAALESQVKELRNVASVNGDLLDSTVIRNWIELQKKAWFCSK